MYSELDDEALIKRWVSTRDKDAFKLLYLRYRHMVYRMAIGYLGNDRDAEDVTQEIFIKTLLNKAGQFSGVSFRSWLSSVVRNACIDMIRARNSSKIDPSVDINSDDRLDTLNLENPILPPETILERMQQAGFNHERIWAALHKLPFKQREVVVLRYFSELSSKEIGNILQCGENNVNVNLHHALKKLAALSAEESHP